MPPSPTEAPKKEISFATLAAVIRGWTTNLLALAILLVLGIVVGWQLATWLNEAPPPPLALAEEPPANVRLLSHGGPLQIDRVTGELPAVRDVLRKRCFETAAKAAPQGDAGPGETRFLARLAKETPREQSGEVALYEPSGEPVMTVLVDRRQERIVAWAFAFPANEGVWSCYTFCPGAALIAPLLGSSETSGVTQ